MIVENFNDEKDCVPVLMQSLQEVEDEVYGLKQRETFHRVVKFLHHMGQNIGAKRKNMIESVNWNKLRDHVKENQWMKEHLK